MAKSKTTEKEKKSAETSDEYEIMLNYAYENMPKSYFEAERFEIPKVRGHIQGNKTIISNMNEIVSILGRPDEHILKYLLKELATPGEIKKGFLILKRKIAASIINDKIKQYAKTFVLCSECGKPDTKLIKEKDLMFLKCMACGAKYYIKTKI